MNTKHCSAGVSLLELLVVISLVMILGALLFAGFGKMQERGDATKYTSNLRKTAQAMHAFAADNSGRFPHLMKHVYNPETDEWEGDNKTLWHFVIAPYIGDALREDPKRNDPRVILRSALRDPSDRTLTPNASPRPTRNIGMNGSHAPGNPPIGAANRLLATIQHPAELMLLGPSATAADYWSTSSEWGMRGSRIVPANFNNMNGVEAHFRYRSGGELASYFAFADGHVELVTASRIMEEAAKAQAGGSRFFDAAAANP